MIFDKEYFLKLLTAVLDGHARQNSKSRSRPPAYCDGIKHVRGLFDEGFEEVVRGEDLLEFSVGLICSIQPEDPRHNRDLPMLEQGILAASYFLYSAMQPLLLQDAQAERSNSDNSEWLRGPSIGEWPNQ